MKAQGQSFIGSVAGLAAGVVVLFAANATGISAAASPRIDTSPFTPPAAQIVPVGLPQAPIVQAKDVGKMTPLANLKSYRYAIDARFTGAEAEVAAKRVEEDGLDVTTGQKKGEFSMQYRGVVVGPMQTSVNLTMGPTKATVWLKGDRFERKVASRPIEKVAGPFEKSELESVNLYAAEYHWDRGVSAWFEENREHLSCLTATESVNGEAARSCEFSGLSKDAKFALLDNLGGGTFQTLTTFDVEVSFMPLRNAPVHLSIEAAGKDKSGTPTGLEFTMDLSDIDKSGLTLPAAPSAAPTPKR